MRLFWILFNLFFVVYDLWRMIEAQNTNNIGKMIFFGVFAIIQFILLVRAFDRQEDR